MLLEIGRSFGRIALERHSASVYILYAYGKVLLCVDLTTELSGRPPLPLRFAEHTIYCEDEVPTVNHGPLQRVVRPHLHFG